MPVRLKNADEEKSGGSYRRFALVVYLPPQLQQFVGVSAPPSAMPAGKKSSTGKQTLSNISQGSSQELHEMLPTGWQLPLGMQ